MAEEEKVYVVDATSPLHKVMMCSPAYYTFNGINVITAEWMKKGDTEKNDVMVKEWQMLVDAYKDNGIEVVEVEANPEYQVMTFARDYGCMIKEGAVIGHFRHPVRQVEAATYEAKLKEMGVPFGDHRAVQMTRADYDRYDLLLAADSANVRNMTRIAGGDPDHKIRRLLDDCPRPRDIADPWYTGNFDVTYDDIVEGCEALLDRLEREGKT